MVRVEYITNQFFNSRTYVLSTEMSEEVWLVDCGDVEKALEAYAIGKQVKGVLLTHTHADHIYGINCLMELFPDVAVYTNMFGAEALSNPKLNITRYHQEVPDFEISNPNNVVVVNEGTNLLLFEDVWADVFLTDGHDASCLTFQIGKFLFTGDAYIPGIQVVTKFPKSNKQLAIETEARIKKMANNLLVCPGHTL